MKIKISIIIAAFIICLFGCSRESVVEEEKVTAPNETEMEQQDIAETVSENEWNKDEAEIFITNSSEIKANKISDKYENDLYFFSDEGIMFYFNRRITNDEKNTNSNASSDYPGISWERMKLYNHILIPYENISKDNGEMEDKESFFFSPGVEVKRVNIVSTIPDLPDNMNLIIEHIESYPKGDLYELRLDYEKEFSCRNYDGWDRRNLGYFYVEGNLIYRIKENEADEICTWSEEELKNMGTIVCQESPLEDKLGVEARGFHETIDIDGNSCLYKSYYNNVDTDFYESFSWEKGKGLVNYYSGYGAQSFHLEINLDEK